MPTKSETRPTKPPRRQEASPAASLQAIEDVLHNFKRLETAAGEVASALQAVLERGAMPPETDDLKQLHELMDRLDAYNTELRVADPVKWLPGLKSHYEERARASED